MKIQVAIIMGSDSDLPIMQDAALVLDQFRIPYELTVVSAHRTPDRVKSFVKKAERKGVKVVIAAAGGSAHLPGMTAAYTHLPVIGVPIKTKTMDGLDSLLSIVQMPPGVPVATVAVNGAKNAALLAIQILSSKNSLILKKIRKFKMSMKKEVITKARRLEKIKYKKYLKNSR